MKLMTEVYDSGGGGRDLYFTRQSQVEHDAAAAHALMWAMREMANIPPCCDPYEVPAMITERADELMAEWGFDRERVDS